MRGRSGALESKLDSMYAKLLHDELRTVIFNADTDVSMRDIVRIKLDRKMTILDKVDIM